MSDRAPERPDWMVTKSPKWSSDKIAATANDVYADMEDMFVELITPTNGIVAADTNTKMTLFMSPQAAAALRTTNSFGVDVYDMLQHNFPRLKFVIAKPVRGGT